MSFQEEYQKIEQKYLLGEWEKEKKLLKQKLQEKPIVLYGLGFFGAVIVRNFKLENIEVECFCDSKKRGIDNETGLNIISPEELVSQYGNANIVISVANPTTEQSVYNTITSLGIAEQQIFRFKDAYQFIRKSRVEQVAMSLEEFQEYRAGYERAYNFFEDEESKKVVIETIKNYLFHDLFEYDNPKESYFPQQFCFSQQEVFVDGGLYTGDTTEEFIRQTGKEYKRIIGFDIDDKNLEAAYKNLQDTPGLEIVKKGLWDCSTFLHAELGITAGSNIKEEAEDVVELTSLDEVFKDSDIEEYPTFIKLDIEGSEQQALKGAEKIIRQAKPKLAVCVYHKPEDIYVLLELLQKYNPEYRFFLKHYSPYIWDTVLYAY